MSNDSSQERTIKFPWIWVGMLLLLVIGIALVFHFNLQTRLREQFQQTIAPWVNTHPISGPIAFMMIYIVATLLVLPGSILAMVSGALFGPVLGIFWVIIPTLVAASIAFLLSRLLGKNWIEQKKNERLDKIQKGIKKEGWRFVAFTRLVPILPYGLQNYLYGLTRVSFLTYFLVTSFAMIPGIFAFVYAGHTAKVAVTGEVGVESTVISISVVIGIVILLSLIPKFFRS